ncbi:MAG: DUF5107 domain-containing protein [Deltaproteobacteria bacterium]|nr:DUF5107 domain-containing protein [Deltaproteobacteria bacterium]
MKPLATALFALAILPGCPEGGGGGTGDGGTTKDDGTRDASRNEGTTDEGTRDNGTIDEETWDDGARDDGTWDAGTKDGGTWDAEQDDAGSGTEDGGTDSGVVVTPVALTETKIAIRTHVYEQFLKTFPDGHPLHPYRTLDWDAFASSGRVEDVEYTAVILENEYVVLTVLPRLGGRIWRWQSKVTGRDQFYVNPAGIKPCHFSYLGWWLASGGIEFSFPVEEHGYVFSVPWDYETSRDADGSASIREWVTDAVSGLTLEVAVTLRPGRSDWEMEIAAANPTPKVVSYQLWLNAMLAPGGGADTAGDTVFVYPTDTMIVHGGDAVLGNPRDLIPWPVHKGMDLSRYSTWLAGIDGAGLFVKDNAEPYVGSWVPSKNEGIVRVFDKDVPRGVKLWSFGRLKPTASADYANANPPTAYYEIWGGVTDSFFDFAGFLPDGTVGWKERWAAPSGIGGLSRANDATAVYLDAPASVAQNVTIAATVGAVPFSRSPDGNVRLVFDGREVFNLDVALAPDAPMLAQVDFGIGLLPPGIYDLELVHDLRNGTTPLRDTRKIEVK